MNSSTEEEELDIYSDKFNPLKALYSNKMKLPSVQKMENLGTFLSRLKAADNKLDADLNEFKRTQSKKKDSQLQPTTGQDEDDKYHRTVSGRVFLKEQAPVKGKIKAKHERNLLQRMERAKGPLALLRKFQENRTRVRIYTRKEHGIRGYLTGFIDYFDKHQNIFLVECKEVWKRRKFDFSENKIAFGEPQDCSKLIERMGIKVPKIQAKSIDRKHVECERVMPKLLIRGEDVVLISEDNLNNNPQ